MGLLPWTVVFLGIRLILGEPSIKHCKETTRGIDYDCRGRSLEAIPYDVFDDNLYIKLGNNPYVCDCSMVWFLREPGHKKKDIEDLETMKCARPVRLANKTIVSLTEKDICPTALQVNSSVCRPHEDLDVLECFSRPTKNHIPFDIFDTKFSRIYLARKPNCDCNMVWFIRKLKAKKFRSRIANLDGIQCSSPETMKNQHILLITENKICPQKDPDFCKKPNLCNETISTCRNTKGSYECVDINECTENTHKCQTGEECVNKKDGYGCQCKPGLVKAKHGVGCIDPKACSEQNKICPISARCEMIDGSYQCVCKSGYFWKERYCLDIDECILNSHHCDSNALCSNHAGGYNCHCKEGYKEFKKGRLCLLKEEKKTSHSNVIVIVAPLICFLLSLALTACLCKRKTNKKEQNLFHDPDEERKILLRNQENAQQQMFMLDNRILPEDSLLSQWSEDEKDYDDDECDFD